MLQDARGAWYCPQCRGAEAETTEAKYGPPASEPESDSDQTDRKHSNRKPAAAASQGDTQEPAQGPKVEEEPSAGGDRTPGMKAEDPGLQAITRDCTMREKSRLATLLTLFCKPGVDAPGLVLMVGYTYREAHVISDVAAWMATVGRPRLPRFHWCNPPLNAYQAAASIELQRNCPINTTSCGHMPTACDCYKFDAFVVDEWCGLTQDRLVVLANKIKYGHAAVLAAYDHCSYLYAGEHTVVYNLRGDYTLQPGPNARDTHIEQYERHTFMLHGQGEAKTPDANDGVWYALWRHDHKRCASSDVYCVMPCTGEVPRPQADRTLTLVATVQDERHVGEVVRSVDGAREFTHSLFMHGPGSEAAAYNIGYSTGSHLLVDPATGGRTIVAVPKSMVSDAASRFSYGRIDVASVSAVTSTTLRTNSKYNLGPNADVISKVAVMIAVERAVAMDIQLLQRITARPSPWARFTAWIRSSFNRVTHQNRLVHDIERRNDLLSSPPPPAPYVYIGAGLAVALFVWYRSRRPGVVLKLVFAALRRSAPLPFTLSTALTKIDAPKTAYKLRPFDILCAQAWLGMLAVAVVKVAPFWLAAFLLDLHGSAQQVLVSMGGSGDFNTLIVAPFIEETFKARRLYAPTVVAALELIVDARASKAAGNLSLKEFLPRVLYRLLVHNLIVIGGRGDFGSSVYLHAMLNFMITRIKGGAPMTLGECAVLETVARPPPLCATSVIRPPLMFVDKCTQALKQFGPSLAGYVCSNYAKSTQNEMVALAERLLRRRQVTPPALAGRMAAAAKAITDYMCDEKNVLLRGVMSFHSWVQRYPAGTRNQMQRALDELRAGQAPTVRDMFRATANLKMEKGAWVAGRPVGVVATDKAPRVIVGFQPYPNVIMGPVQATMKKAIQRGLAGSALVYAPGNTGTSLGQRLSDFVDSCDGYTLHESDVSKMDANVNKVLADAVMVVWRHFGLHKLNRFGKRCDKWYKELARVRGRGTCGTTFAFSNRTPSGIVYTTDANTLIVMMVLLDGYAHAYNTTPDVILSGLGSASVPRMLLMVGGDDSLVAISRPKARAPAARMSESGLPFKSKTPTINTATFLSGRFYPCTRRIKRSGITERVQTLCLAPKVGRVIARSGWFVQPPHGVSGDALVRGTALGLMANAFVPVMGTYLSRLLELTSRCTTPHQTHEYVLYRTPARERADLRANQHTMGMVCDAYRTTPDAIMRAERHLATVTTSSGVWPSEVAPFLGDLEDVDGDPIVANAAYSTPPAQPRRWWLLFLALVTFLQMCQAGSAPDCASTQDLGANITNSWQTLEHTCSTIVWPAEPPGGFLFMPISNPKTQKNKTNKTNTQRPSAAKRKGNGKPSRTMKATRVSRPQPVATILRAPAARSAAAAAPTLSAGQHHDRGEGKVMTAPVAVAKVMRKSLARPFIMAFREEVGDITVADSFANTPMLINPGNEDLFPWGALIAQRFTTYKYRKSPVFEYVPSTDTGVGGTVAIAVNADPDADPFTTVQQTLNHIGSATAAPWVPFTVSAAQASADNVKRKYVADVTGSTGDGVRGFFQDLGLVADGVVNVVTDALALLTGDPTTTTPVDTGKLFVSYEVELYDPKLDTVPDDGISAFSYNDATNNFSVETPFLPGEPTNPLRIVCGGATYSFAETGRYMAFISTIASSGTFAANDFVIDIGGPDPTGYDIVATSWNTAAAGAAGINYYIAPTSTPYGAACWAIIDAKTSTTSTHLAVQYSGPTSITAVDSRVSFIKISDSLAGMVSGLGRSTPRSMPDIVRSVGYFAARRQYRQRQAARVAAEVRAASVAQDTRDVKSDAKGDVKTAPRDNATNPATGAATAAVTPHYGLPAPSSGFVLVNKPGAKNK